MGNSELVLTGLIGEVRSLDRILCRQGLGEREEEMSWGLRRRGWATDAPWGLRAGGRPPVHLGLSRVNTEHSEKLGWPVTLVQVTHKWWGGLSWSLLSVSWVENSLDDQ